MKKLSKTISLMLAFVMVLSLPNLLLVNVQALEIGSEESLGAVNACNGHILGTFSGVPACVNESGDLHICENNFPDENFRNCIDQQCGRDGYFTETEKNALEVLDIGNKQISSMQGVEFFNQLCNLLCYNNYLTDLTLSNNAALSYLNCSNNRLTALDLRKNTVLTELNCSSNQLTEINVSNNTALTKLICGNNLLTELDLSNNTILTYLNCFSNQLTELDLSNNTLLTELHCPTNQLTELDLSSNTALTSVTCSSNQLTKLDLSNHIALTSLTCSENQLTELNLSNCIALNQLVCYWNQLTELDVSTNTALTYLSCYWNQLTELNLRNHTALYNLACGANQLTELDLSDCASLRLMSLGGDGVYYQRVSLFIQQKTGKWIVDLSQAVSSENISRIEVKEAEGISYDPQAGIVTYSSEPISFIYSYATGRGDKMMGVEVTPVICTHPNAVWQTQTPATCTEKGTEVEICPNCGAVLNTKEIPETGHSFGEWFVEKPASMTEDGLEVRICSVCKEREEKILPAGEYLPGDVDNNGKVDDKDATYLLMYIFYPEDYPVRQDCDFNHDGEITDEDASYLLYYTFFPDDYPLIKQ